MYLSEIRVKKEVLCAIFFIFGIFFTFCGLPMKNITFYLFGFLGASLGVEFLLDWITEEFIVDINQNLWWGIVAAIGVTGGWIAGSNEKLSMFLSAAIPAFFLLSTLWQATGIERVTYPIFDGFGKSFFCLSISTILGVLLVKDFSHVYENFLVCTTAFFGAYCLCYGVNIVFEITQGKPILPIGPDQLLEMTSEDLIQFDLVGATIGFSSLFATCVLGITVQYLRYRQMNRSNDQGKRKSTISGEHNTKRRSSKRSRRESRHSSYKKEEEVDRVRNRHHDGKSVGSSRREKDDGERGEKKRGGSTELGPQRSSDDSYPRDKRGDGKKENYYAKDR